MTRDELAAALSPFVCVRVARKPWRCVCADPERSVWEVTGKLKLGRGGQTMGRGAREQVDRVHARMLANEDDYESITPPHHPANPHYRSDCEGDIPVGAAHAEDVSDAPPYASGLRYCATCALALFPR